MSPDPDDLVVVYGHIAADVVEIAEYSAGFYSKRAGKTFAFAPNMRHIYPSLTSSFALLLCLALMAQPGRAQDSPLHNLSSPAGSEPLEFYEPPPSTLEALALWKDFFTSSNLLAIDTSQISHITYLEILKRWARDSDPDDVELVAELEHRLRQVPRCYPLETDDLLKLIGYTEPGAVLPAAMLHVYAWQHKLDHRRFARLENYVDRIEDFMKLHVKTLKRSEASKLEAAGLLTHLAERIWDSGYVNLLPAADQALDAALTHYPDHVPARYLRAMVAEKQGFYRRALKDLEVLSRLRPLQGDITLRLAVQLVRRDEKDRARRLLDGLIDRNVLIDDWVHTVAYQERARLAIDEGQDELAHQLLARAQKAYPQNRRFAVMDIELARRDTGRSDPRTRRLLDTWNSDFGITPRLRYLQRPTPELKANHDQLSAALIQHLPALVAGVRKVRSRNLGGSRPCNGTMRRLRPDAPPEKQAAAIGSAFAERRHHSTRRARAGSKVRPGSSPMLDRTATARQTTMFSHSPSMPPAVSSKAGVPISSASLGMAVDPTPAADFGQPVKKPASNFYVDPETGQTFRVDEVMDLDLQQIYVTPSRLGKRNIELSAAQVKVLDEGRPQQVITFEQGEIPFTATLLLDASGSMRGPRIDRALAGARAFITEMAELDRSRVVLAADRLRGVSPFVSADDAATVTLTERLDDATADGGTALFDYLFMTLDALEPEQGRKVVIVLSDGYDQMSVVPMESVRQAARRSQTQIYWVRLREDWDHANDFTPPTGWRPVGRTMQQISLFERTVNESGGDVVEISSADEVADAFAQILTDLRNQIAIGYYPDPSHGDGRWREVDVKAKRTGVRMRHASGYFDG